MAGGILAKAYQAVNKAIATRQWLLFGASFLITAVLVAALALFLGRR